MMRARTLLHVQQLHGGACMRVGGEAEHAVGSDVHDWHHDDHRRRRH